MWEWASSPRLCVARRAAEGFCIAGGGTALSFDLGSTILSVPPVIKWVTVVCLACAAAGLYARNALVQVADRQADRAERTRLLDLTRRMQAGVREMEGKMQQWRAQRRIRALDPEDDMDEAALNAALADLSTSTELVAQAVRPATPPHVAIAILPPPPLPPPSFAVLGDRWEMPDESEPDAGPLVVRPGCPGAGSAALYDRIPSHDIPIHKEVMLTRFDDAAELDREVTLAQLDSMLTQPRPDPDKPTM